MVVTAVLKLWPQELQAWWRSLVPLSVARLFPHLALAPLLPCVFLGPAFGQARLAWLALTLGSAHALIWWVHPTPPEGYQQALGFWAPWALPILLVTPEAGIRRPVWWVRPGGLLLLMAGALLSVHAKGTITSMSSHSVISAGAALLALILCPSRDGSAVKWSWSLALLALCMGLSKASGFWPRQVEEAIWPLGLGLAGVYLLFGINGLVWTKAYVDELTGIPGRRGLEEAFRSLGRRYTIAMVDVDHFKRFNDTYGHEVGDQVLKFVASKLKGTKGAKAFRYGGEEFTILMPGMDMEEALAGLEELRRAIESSRFKLRGRDRPARRPGSGSRPRGSAAGVSVTVSVGAAARSPLCSTPQEVLAAADRALYRAKRMGRNRVECERRRKRRA